MQSAAESDCLELIVEPIRFVLAHQHGLLAWDDFPISSGPLEGTNRKIRALQSVHYGFRDAVYFDLRLYDLHNSTYALVGT